MRFSGLPALLQRKGGDSPSRHASSRGEAMSQRRGCLAVTESVPLGHNLDLVSHLSQYNSAGCSTPRTIETLAQYTLSNSTYPRTQEEAEVEVADLNQAIRSSHVAKPRAEYGPGGVTLLFSPSTVCLRHFSSLNMSHSIPSQKCLSQHCYFTASTERLF